MGTSLHWELLCFLVFYSNRKEMVIGLVIKIDRDREFRESLSRQYDMILIGHISHGFIGVDEKTE